MKRFNAFFRLITRRRECLLYNNKCHCNKTSYKHIGENEEIIFTFLKISHIFIHLKIFFIFCLQLFFIFHIIYERAARPISGRF